MFCVALCWETGDRLVLAEEGFEASHSIISCVLWIFHNETKIETVAVHVTLGTERYGDSPRTFANDAHVCKNNSMPCIKRSRG